MSKKLASQKTPDYFAEFNSDDAEVSSLENVGSPAAKEDFAKMLGESLRNSNKKLTVGDKITGKILSLGSENVYVSTGTQHDGVIRKIDLLEADGTCNYKTDDTITLYVTQVRGSDIRLSKNPTDRNLAEDLEDAFDMMLPIQGRVVEVVKGGVRVNLKGKLAFCPISQLESKHIETADEYVGKSFDFRITQFSEGGRNIVVSRRKLLDEERELGTASFLEEHKDGDVVTAKISRLEKFGAFVELAPGLDGLVHISEIAWSRIADPSEILQPGQEVTVKILKREILNGRAKISLSIKQAISEADKLAALKAQDEARANQRAKGSGPDGAIGAPAFGAKTDPSQKFSVGQVLTGKVTRKEVYGFFIEIEPGVQGLLHKSRTLDNNEFRFEKVKVGDELTVQVSEIKPAERQIALQLPRDAGEDDWKEHVKASSASASGSLGTFGDLFKNAKPAKK